MLTPSTIKLLAVSSVFLLVVSIGLQARFGSVFRVFSDAQDRQKILGALAAMFLAVPLVAYLVVLLGVPGPTAGAVILAFSIAPIAPILPRKQLKFGGGTDWVTAFQVTGTLLSLALATLKGTNEDCECNPFASVRLQGLWPGSRPVAAPLALGLALA
jgi:BASS family bile acid:Na+ symporter